MRNILALATLAILSYFSYGFSAMSLEEAIHSLNYEDKIHISSDQLAVQDEGMFVQFDDLWFQIDSLFTDEKGLFIKDFRRKDDHRCAEYYVSCRNCDRCVSEAYDMCPYCGKPV